MIFKAIFSFKCFDLTGKKNSICTFMHLLDLLSKAAQFSFKIFLFKIYFIISCFGLLFEQHEWM